MQAWEEFLLRQEKELGVDTVQKWLRTLKVRNYDACNLYLEANDAFQVLWFEEHIRKKIKGTLFNNNRKPIKVHVAQEKDQTSQENKPKKRKSDEKEKPSFELVFDELNPFCTFDTFVADEENLLAHKLLCRIAHYDPISKQCIDSETDLASFNPIYLHGRKGSGKTHLLMATAHALREMGLEVIYVRTETFTRHVVTAIRAGEMCKFRQAYRNIDVLMIDDVHQFSRKGATQEELFHTFNTLHLAGKQIILGSSCAPGELQMIEPRLVSRFEWGIVLPVDPVKREMRVQLLELKAKAMDCELHPKVLKYLVDTFSSSNKSMIQALEALVLRSDLDQKSATFAYKKITIPFVKQTIGDLIDEEQKHSITPDKIIQVIADTFQVESDDIFGKGQTREYVLPRQMAMYFCRNQLKMPYTKIGDLFDRDHSTVMSSVKLIQSGVDQNEKEIASRHLEISKKLRV